MTKGALRGPSSIAYMVLLGKVNNVEIETDRDTPPEIFYLD